MKKCFLVLSVFCLFITACYMNYSKRIVYYPDVPDILFDQMSQVLQEMGYQITTNEKYPDPIIAKNPFVIGKKGQLAVMVTFIRAPKETAIEIHVSQAGAKISSVELDQIRDEVVAKFNTLIKNRGIK